MVRGDTCVRVQMGQLRVVSSDTPHESWLQSFCVHHVAFCVYHVSNMEAGEREFLNCFFGDKQQATRLRILAWASIAENPGWRQLAEISLAENSWLRTPGS